MTQPKKTVRSGMSTNCPVAKPGWIGADGTLLDEGSVGLRIYLRTGYEAKDLRHKADHAGLAVQVDAGVRIRERPRT